MTLFGPHCAHCCQLPVWLANSISNLTSSTSIGIAVVQVPVQGVIQSKDELYVCSGGCPIRNLNAEGMRLDLFSKCVPNVF
jgi:hypothetical protein